MEHSGKKMSILVLITYLVCLIWVPESWLMSENYTRYFFVTMLAKILQDFIKVIKEYIGNNETHKIEWKLPVFADTIS